MAELSGVLIDVWSQVLVHDSKAVRLGSETFPVIRSKKKRFRQVYFVFDGIRQEILTRRIHNVK